MSDKYTPEQLKNIGTALYGRSWQSDMANDLGMKDARRVRYWANGEREIPPGVWGDLKRIARERGERLISISENLHEETEHAE